MKKAPHLFRFFLAPIFIFAFGFLSVLKTSAQQKDKDSEEVSIADFQ
jgi:hypothetical protein